MKTKTNLCHSPSQVKSAPFSRVAAAALLGLLLATRVNAGIVAEDFAYSTGTAVGLAGQNGGIGWGAPWDGAGTSRPFAINTPLTYTGGGYNIVQTNGAGQMYATFTGYRGCLRTNSPALSNVVWFSFLAESQIGLQAEFVGINETIETSGVAYNPSDAYTFGVSNTTLYEFYGSTGSGVYILNATAATNLALNTVHLILGCITFQASNNLSQLQLWADPADLTHPGLPVFQETAHNIGSNLFNIEVGSVNDGSLGALRFSDGNGNAVQAYTDVTGSTNYSLITEDFAYSAGNLAGDNGGSAWLAPWDAAGTSRALIQTNVLTYTNGGYNIIQAPGAASEYGTFTAYRGALRTNSPNTANIVWFSALMLEVSNISQSYIGFNNTAETAAVAYNPSTAYSVGISNTTLVIGYGTSLALTYTSVTNLANNAVHLILGCITFQASGNVDELQVWADPPDLTHPGTPAFQQTLYDIGNNLFNVEVGSANNGATAALRFSDGGGSAAQAYTAVTGSFNASSTSGIPITANPLSTNVACGANVQFTVAAAGSPLQYQWLQNGNPIASATNSLLVLTNVSALNRGAYSVVITNSVASVGGVSTPAALRVTNCNANLLWLGGNLLWDEVSPNWGFVGGVPTNLVAFGDGDSVTFDDTTPYSTLTVVGTVAPASVTINGAVDTWMFNPGPGTIAGTGSFTDNALNNPGQVYDNVNNTFTGGLYLDGGIFRIAVDQVPTNVIVNGGEFVFQADNGTWAGNLTGTNVNSSVVTAGAFSGTITLSGTIDWAGQVGVHGGTVALTGSNNFTGVGAVNGQTGVSVSVGFFGGYNTSPTLLLGSPHAIGSGPGAGLVELNGGAQTNFEGILDMHGFDQTINGLTGTSTGGSPLGTSTTVNGEVINSGSGTNTLTVGAADATASFPGTIAGSINLVKIGAGTQTLSGTTAYNNTVISNGTLNETGSIETTQLDVWGGVLAGNGYIYGLPNINVHPGGTLALVPNTISTFNIGIDVTLQGTTVMSIDKDFGLQSDQITGFSQLTEGGTLVVNDIGSTPLAPGDTFTLFNGPLSGAFSSFVLPIEATWNTSKLASQGTISVVSVLPTNLATIYQDSFSYHTNLNGTRPDTFGALPWIADPSWIAAGSGAAGNSPTSANAFLPFVPQAGYVYTLSATVDCNPPSTNSFMALGFANGAGTGVAWQGTNNPVGWWLIQPDSSSFSQDIVYLGPGETANSASGLGPPGPNNYSVILDTRNWTVTFLVNGGVVAGPTAFGLPYPPITTVGFGGYLTNSNTVQNFTLTVAGPSSLAPVILMQPTGGTFLAGSTAVLSAYASGFLVTYQWKLNSSAITGATNAALTLANLSTANAGTYSLVVSNPSGSVTSSNAVVTVVTSLPAGSNTLTEQVTFNTDNVLPSVPVNTNNDLMITQLASVSPAPTGNTFDGVYMYNGTTGTAFENSTINPLSPMFGTWQFVFNTTTNSAGYDLTSIVTYSASSDFAAGQNYSVYYQQVGSASFNLLTNVNIAEYGGSLRVALTNSLGGKILSGISALQFVLAANITDGLDVYREVEVDGTPTAIVARPTTLSIALKGSSAVLSWPASSTGYRLTSSPVLSPSASWQAVAGTPTVVNGTNQVTVSITGSAQFYRLVNP